MIAVFILAVEAFAAPGVAGVVIQPTDLEVVIVFTPLLACLAIWIGLAMSIRSGDIRVAQQASLLCCVPLLILIALVAFGAIDVDRREVIVAFAALVVADVAGWRVIAPMFDRERLIRGTPG